MMIPQTAPCFEIDLPSMLPQSNYAIETAIDQMPRLFFGGIQTAVPTMRRILVVGSSGSGKSTLSRQLGGVLHVPVIHLDRHFWQAGWQETPSLEWQSRVRSLTAGKAWIMDGNYRSTLEMRLAAADTVVFLDLPRWLCVLQATKRRVQYAWKPRPDIASGCQEWLFDPQYPQFVRRIWSYPHRARAQLLARLVVVQKQKRVVHLTSQTAVSQFLTNPWHYPAGLQRQPTDVAYRVDGSVGAQLAFDEGNFC